VTPTSGDRLSLAETRTEADRRTARRTPRAEPLESVPTLKAARPAAHESRLLLLLEALPARRVGYVGLGLITFFGVMGVMYEEGMLDRLPRNDDFALDGEWDLPVVYNASLMWAAGALTVALAGLRRAYGESRTWWVFLAAVFVYMGLDDLFQLHEGLSSATGVSWQILYLPIIAMAFAAWLVAVRRLREHAYAVWLLTAGAGAWVLAEGLEVLQFDDRGLQLGFDFYGHETIPALMIAEEVLEALGALGFLVAVMLVTQMAARSTRRSRRQEWASRRAQARTECA
jgi:hypothetical protein